MNFLKDVPVSKDFHRFSEILVSWNIDEEKSEIYNIYLYLIYTYLKYLL